MTEESPLEQSILKDSKFNTAVAANTDIFSSALSPTASPTFFRIYATFDTAGVLTVRRKHSGVTISENLNSGANLNANAAYSFVVEVEEEETIQLRFSVNATALKLAVIEIGEGI